MKDLNRKVTVILNEAKDLFLDSSAFGLRMTILCCLISMSGCGYTRQAALPEGVKTIYVQTVQNKIPVEKIYTYQPGLEMLISNNLVKRFKQDGNLQVVEKDKADAILETDLVAYDQDGLRFNNLETVEEYRLRMTVNLRLRDAKSSRIILEENEFTGDAEYFVSEIRSIGREEASQRAAERLARNVVDRIVEDW